MITYYKIILFSVLDCGTGGFDSTTVAASLLLQATSSSHLPTSSSDGWPPPSAPSCPKRPPSRTWLYISYLIATTLLLKCFLCFPLLIHIASPPLPPPTNRHIAQGCGFGAAALVECLHRLYGPNNTKRLSIYLSFPLLPYIIQFKSCGKHIQSFVNILNFGYSCVPP